MKFKLFLAGILLSVLPALNSCNGSGGAKRAGGDTEVTELRCRDLDDRKASIGPYSVGRSNRKPTASCKRPGRSKSLPTKRL